MNNLVNKITSIRLISYGNICGALTTSGYGAVDACPDALTVAEFLETIEP